MADQTVAESADKYGYNDVQEALRKTAQAMAIMRVLSLAVAAQEDGSVIYDNNKFSRWGPVVDAACERVHAVRDALQNKANAPDAVDWWTSLAILEATGAALWHTGGPSHDDAALEAEQVQSVADSAFDCLESMYGELTAIADTMVSERDCGGAA